MEIYNQTLEFMYCVTSPRNPVRKTSKRICWEKPLSGWKKLNTDGSFIGCMEQTGCGGVIRDEHGNWVAGFTRHAEQLTTLLLNFGSLGMVLCCVVA